MLSAKTFVFGLDKYNMEESKRYSAKILLLQKVNVVSNSLPRRKGEGYEVTLQFLMSKRSSISKLNEWTDW